MSTDPIMNLPVAPILSPELPAIPQAPRAAITAGWAPGTYKVTEYVTSATERQTLSTQPLRILPNLAAASAGADTRTHARKTLDAIEGWLETRAPGYALIWVDGRKLENRSIPDLLVLRDRYRAEVAAEDRKAAGLGAVRILARL